MLHVQDLFNSVGLKEGIQELKKLGIIVDEKYENLLLLNYSQIESDSFKYNNLVKECRALIIDKNNFSILARTFDKFYNYGEDPNSKVFSFSEAICGEKIDGSLIYIWFNPYKNNWQISTRKLAEAEGNVGAFKISFKDLIIKFIFDDKFLEFTKILNKDLTYIFELVGPKNRIIDFYPKEKLYFLAARNKSTSEEFCIGMTDYNNIYMELNKNCEHILSPKIYTFNSLENIQNYINENLKDIQEGFVAQINSPNNVWRIKIKNPKYIKIFHLKENGIFTINPRKITKMVLAYEEDEYLSYFPEDRPLIESYIIEREILKERILRSYKSYSFIENQKEFALEVINDPLCSFLFELRKGKTIEEIFKKLSDDEKTNMLNKVVNIFVGNISFKN